MKVLQAIVGGYLVFGLFYAVYKHFSGVAHTFSSQDLGLHLAQALFWPMFVFPSFGKFVSGMVMLAVIGAVLAGKSRG